MTPFTLIESESAKNNKSPQADKLGTHGRLLIDIMKKARAKMRLFDIEGYVKAVALLRHVINASPLYGPAHAALGEIYSHWGFRLELNGKAAESFYSLAMRHAKRALDLAPEQSESHRSMAVALRRGEYANDSRRKEEILTALDLDPGLAENWYEYWRAFGYQSTDPTILRAMELDPENPGMYIDFAVVLCGEGRLAEAERHLRQALKLAPRNSLALYNLSMVLDRRNAPKEALAVLRTAEEMHPEDPLVQRGLYLLTGGVQ